MRRLVQARNWKPVIGKLNSLRNSARSDRANTEANRKPINYMAGEILRGKSLHAVGGKSARLAISLAIRPDHTWTC